MNTPCIVLNPDLDIGPDLDIEYAARLLANVGVYSASILQQSLLGIVSMTNIL